MNLRLPYAYIYIYIPLAMQPILRPHYTKSGKAGRLERVDNIRFSGQLEFRGILRGLAYWLTGFPTAPFLLFFFLFFPLLVPSLSLRQPNLYPPIPCLEFKRFLCRPVFWFWGVKWRRYHFLSFFLSIFPRANASSKG